MEPAQCLCKPIFLQVADVATFSTVPAYRSDRLARGCTHRLVNDRTPSDVHEVRFVVDDDIAILAILSGVEGIFLKYLSVPTPFEVISVGDSLFGGTVTDLSMSIDAVNNDDVIAFQYQLANGVRGVALAHVPETSSFVLISAACLAVPAVRRCHPRAERRSHL